jgi:hypothetical protein
MGGILKSDFCATGRAGRLSIKDASPAHIAYEHENLWNVAGGWNSECVDLPEVLAAMAVREIPF